MGTTHKCLTADGRWRGCGEPRKYVAPHGDDAVERTVFGAFCQSGQSCIDVQRILVHADIYAAFRDRLVAKTKTLVAGDPHDEATFVGPMIDRREAERLSGWIDAAVARGATLPCGGRREGAMLEATLLDDVDPACDLNRDRPARDRVRDTAEPPR